MWRSVIRVVGSSAPTVASNAAMCRMCTTTPALRTASPSARVACSCPAEVHHSNNSQVNSNNNNSGLKQFWDIEDWEIAGDEERDILIFGTLPSQREVEEATSDLQNALRLGLITGSTPTSVESPRTASPATSGSENSSASVLEMEVEEVEYHVISQVTKNDWIEPAPLDVTSIPRSSEVGGRSAMLEAFHQFQHNPQVQKMVVSLATDKGVWDAVLANEQIQEFRTTLRAADGAIEHGADLTENDGNKPLKEEINVFSQFFWNTKTAFSHFIATLQELISGIFDTAEKKVYLSETDDFFERTVRSSMMLSVLVLSLVVFKRSAIHGA